MNTRHLIDPQILPILDLFPNMDLNEETLPMLRSVQPATGIEPAGPSDVVHIPGPDGSPDLELRIFHPEGNETGRPAIYHMHGGGFVAGSAAMMDSINSARATAYGAVLVAVDYRLAPENPFPGPIEDCYAGLCWMVGNAGRLGIDPDRIVVMGESAGGGYAAALALLARDRKGPKIAAQFLVYPMLDHRTGSEADVYANPHTGEFIWTRQQNQFGWRALNGKGLIPAERIGHFSPSLAEDLSGLPPCYMATASLDLFLEENIDYALRLTRAGISTEIHSYGGAIHAFDLVADADVSRCFAADIGNALQRIFTLGRF